MIRPVILSGGGGTRLWPLSRSGNPKQFQPIVGDQTLLKLRDAIQSKVEYSYEFRGANKCTVLL